MLGAVLGGSLLFTTLTGAALGSAMGLTGLIILHFFAGNATEMGVLNVWNMLNSFEFSSVPLYIYMGDLLVASGLSARIYGSVTPLIERLPGRLMHSNIVVSTLFGAVSGSSAATSAAVASVAYPELSRRGYAKAPVAASLAAGGTLGLLIPPSLSLLIYGAWQNVSVGRLFMAGVFPGLMLAGLFMVFIAVDSYRRPHLLPPKEKAVPLGPALAALAGLWPLLFLMGTVLGTIYFGLATPTEAAALGIASTLLLGALVGKLTLRGAIQAAATSITSFGMVSFLLIGAAVLSQAVTILGLPAKIGGAITAWELSQAHVVIVVVIFYLLMGIFFDGISLMITTVPFIYPAMVAAGLDPVWIGVFVTIMVEIGMLTPPVGVNLSVVMAVTRGEVGLKDLSIECLPYWFIMMLGVAILTLFPAIVLFLPNTIFTS
jgi:C4-dicarboxylate transporter DctM subunit